MDLNVDHLLLTILKSVCVSTALQWEVSGIEREGTLGVFNQHFLLLLSVHLRVCSSLGFLHLSLLPLERPSLRV